MSIISMVSLYFSIKNETSSGVCSIQSIADNLSGFWPISIVTPVGTHYNYYAWNSQEERFDFARKTVEE
ncbi:unnamed protein product, partial [marine sediment metagenome]